MHLTRVGFGAWAIGGGDWARDRLIPDLVRARTSNSAAEIRNPAAVRSWPAQQMPAFDPATLGDAEVDAIIAYLRYLGAHSK